MRSITITTAETLVAQLRPLLFFGVLCTALFAASMPLYAQQSSAWSPQALGTPLLRDPIFFYNNWSAYDELSDNVQLTEALAMKELDQILRLRRFGVRIDYYLMDAFWFAPDGGYRKWRTPSWPNGPDEWIRKCRENGIMPGLWFGTNNLVKIEPAPAWQSSLNAKRYAMAFTDGGFLPDFIDTLQFWYDRGIRIYKFDFVDLSAATPEMEKKYSPEEIRSRNAQAFRDALKAFRQKNPEVVLVGYNGFGGDLESTAGPFPFRNVVDLRWLEIFDSLYAGDPRPSDVPQMNFWRSVDIYSDHMVRRFEQSHVPLERIDSCSFMMGNTGTNYYRNTNAWKGMLVLMLARGGWVNAIYGNLELLTDDNARWFARAQALYEPMQATGRTKTFGGIPGEAQPYGFGSVDAQGALYTVLNPSQSIQNIRMPLLSRRQKPNSSGRILFSDAGFRPALRDDTITLGPGQLAVVGFGQYSRAEYDLGVEEDVRIPRSIRQLSATFTRQNGNTFQATIAVPERTDLRIIVQQHGADGSVLRTWGGGPPRGTNMGKILTLRATQGGRAVPIEISYDKVIWSGLSWAAGEIKGNTLQPGAPVVIECASTDEKASALKASVFAVEY